MNDCLDLHKRIQRFARKHFRVSIEDAEDCASFAIAAAFERNALEWPMCVEIAKNYLINFKRSRKHYSEIQLNDDGEPMNAPAHHMPASQHTTLFANEILSAIEGLPQGERDAIGLAALEYTPEEIANTLNVDRADVYYRLSRARDILRRKDDLGLVPTRKYLGVKKYHRKWRAEIKEGRKTVLLGAYKTEIEAARAYDKRAKELGKAKLNFSEGWAA